jgi:hypothetical protein
MSLFYRLSTDLRVIPASWEGACAGPTASACWLIGGGPSLATLPCADIVGSPAPKLAINLSGTKLVRPTFWTAYDPSARFHRSLYLDAGVVKFLPRARAMDVVPETTFKVCECPQTYFFDRDPLRGYHDFLNAHAGGIVDWADSLVQAIDIAYRLGFRRLLLAGCELCVRPSEAWLRRAADAGVAHVDGERLTEFARRCREQGIDGPEQERMGTGPLYHFDEVKPFAAALRSDEHYFRVVQWLRLSRRALRASGMELISVTPRSRLNAFFPYRPVEEMLDRLRVEIGDPQREPTRGLYTQGSDRRFPTAVQMHDFLPPRRSTRRRSCDCGQGSVRAARPGLAPRPGAECGSAGEASPSTELIVEEEAWEELSDPGEIAAGYD